MDPATGFPLVDANGATITADQVSTGAVTPSALPSLSSLSLPSSLSSLSFDFSSALPWLAVAAGAFLLFGKKKRRGRLF